MDDKEKPPLSHTLSLPAKDKHSKDGSGSSGGRVGGGGGGGGGSSGDGRGGGGGSGDHHRGGPKCGRSQSMRQKNPTKVWSLGGMAKAVGSGVTAFGSNVVSSSKAVGSEVYHGSVAVGAGVVEGTKAAGRVTKDVTLAASKGVVHATEKVAEAGKIVTSASVNAVQDTMETMDRTLFLAEDGEGGGSGLLLGGSGDNDDSVHMVLPGQDFAAICDLHNVSAHDLIRENKLVSRKLYPGSKLIIPQQPKSKQKQQGDIRVSHSMETLTVTCYLATGEDETKFSDKCTLTFFPDQVVLLSNGTEERFPTTSATTKNSAVSRLSVKIEFTQEEIPELLPPEKLRDDFAKYSSASSSTSSNIVVVVGGDDDDSNDIILSLTKTDIDDDDDDANLLSSSSSSSWTKKMKCSAQYLDAILSHINLWYPNLLESIPRMISRGEDGVDDDGADEDLPRRQFSSDEVDASSSILSQTMLRAIHGFLPLQKKVSHWTCLYSTAYEGYSLQNFYRKVSTCQEPFVIVIKDTENEIFGAYLTNVIGVTEEFVGTGESWLFQVQTCIT